MVLLYVVICDLHLLNIKREELLVEIEKSLEIFNAMNQVTVSQRCAEITQELLEIAKKASPRLRRDSQLTKRHTAMTSMVMSSGMEVDSESLLHDLSREDFFAGLVEPDFMDAFGRFEDGNFADFDINSVLGPDLSMDSS